MPIYIFECDKDLGGCGNIFDVEAFMSDAPTLKPTCKACRKRKPVIRNYKLQTVTIFDSSPKTLAAQAERNTSRTSLDEQHSINQKNTEYKRQPFSGSLPEGGSLLPRDSDNQRIPSKQQRKTNPRNK